jgi:hypothetical protein
MVRVEVVVIEQAWSRGEPRGGSAPASAAVHRALLSRVIDVVFERAKKLAGNQPQPAPAAEATPELRTMAAIMADQRSAARILFLLILVRSPSFVVCPVI